MGDAAAGRRGLDGQAWCGRVDDQDARERAWPVDADAVAIRDREAIAVTLEEAADGGSGARRSGLPSSTSSPVGQDPSGRLPAPSRATTCQRSSRRQGPRRGRRGGSGGRRGRRSSRRRSCPVPRRARGLATQLAPAEPRSAGVGLRPLDAHRAAALHAHAALVGPQDVEHRRLGVGADGHADRPAQLAVAAAPTPGISARDATVSGVRAAPSSCAAGPASSPAATPCDTRSACGQVAAKPGSVG
jgi:hypothetical protein